MGVVDGTSSSEEVVGLIDVSRCRMSFGDKNNVGECGLVREVEAGRKDG